MKKLLIILLAGLFFVSCEEEGVNLLSDEYVGFDFSETAKSYIRDGSNVPVDAGFATQLIAALKSSPEPRKAPLQKITWARNNIEECTLEKTGKPQRRSGACTAPNSKEKHDTMFAINCMRFVTLAIM